MGGIHDRTFFFYYRKIYNHFHIKYKSLSNLLEIIFNSNSKEIPAIGKAVTNQIQCIVMICIWFVFDYQNRVKNLLGNRQWTELFRIFKIRVVENVIGNFKFRIALTKNVRALI